MTPTPTLFAQQLSSILWFSNPDIEGGLVLALEQMHQLCNLYAEHGSIEDSALARAVIERIEGGDDDENDDQRFDRLAWIGRLLPNMDIQPAGSCR